MKFLRRLSAAVIALGLITLLVYLGILSGKDNQYVVWFGIASAIVAPIGLIAPAPLSIVVSLIMNRGQEIKEK